MQIDQMMHSNMQISRSQSPTKKTAESSQNAIKVVLRIKPLSHNYQQLIIPNSSYIGETTNLNYSSQSNFIKASSTSMDQSSLAKKRCVSDVYSESQLFLASNKSQNNDNNTTTTSGDQYTFDYIAAENVSQVEMFNKVGKPIVESCLLGYNGSIFAYGQTGSGKTYTIQGYNQSDNNDEQRGLLPRCFEYLFARIEQIKSQKGDNVSSNTKNMKINQLSKIPQLSKAVTLQKQNYQGANNEFSNAEFDIKCQYLEIYNENIIDLLDPAQNKILIREDKDRGVWVECTEEKVHSIEDVLKIIAKGSRNRHIAMTNMNRESSRSHAVFTATIVQRYWRTIVSSSDSSISNPSQPQQQESVTKTSRFHIVDLAGSERCKETGAQGVRLKEASMINQSLTTLGAVINDLAERGNNQSENQMSQGGSINRQLAKKGTLTSQGRHIRYRESKLTYLLKDSLGGNSKTVIICNINPHMLALNETRSTLQFAKRAKSIKNKAVINQQEQYSASYWKNKYLEMADQKEKMSQQFSRYNSMQESNPCLVNDSIGQSMQCTQYANALRPDLPNNPYNTNSQISERSWNEETEKNQEYRKLMIQQIDIVKQYTHELKDERDKRKQVEEAFEKTEEEMNCYRHSLMLRISQLQQRESILLASQFQNDKNKSQYNQDQLQQLIQIIETLKLEIDNMQNIVEQNPLVAIKNAKINQLEKEIQDLKQQINFLGNQNEQPNANIQAQQLEFTYKGYEQSFMVEVLFNRVVAYYEKCHELLISQNQQNKVLEQNNDNNESKMEIDSIGIQNNSALNMSSREDGKRYLQNYSQRIEEIANLKIKYEEKLEAMQKQVKTLEAKNNEYLNILSGGGLKANQKKGDQQMVSIGKENNYLADSYLLNSFRLNTGRHNLNDNELLTNRNEHGGLTTINSQLGQQDVKIPAMGLSQKTEKDIVQEMSQAMDQMSQILQEREAKIEWLEVEIIEKEDGIRQLQDQIKQIQNELKEVQFNKDNADYHCIDLEVQIKELEKDNTDAHLQLFTLQQQDDQIDQLKSNIQTLEQEKDNLQESYNYFSQNFIPEMQKQTEILQKQSKIQYDEIQALLVENEKLKSASYNNKDYDQELVVGLKRENDNLRKSAADKVQQLEDTFKRANNMNIVIENQSKQAEQNNQYMKQIYEENIQFSEKIKENIQLITSKDHEYSLLQEKLFDQGLQFAGLESKFQDFMQESQREREHVESNFKNEMNSAMGEINKVQHENAQARLQIITLESNYREVKQHYEIYKDQYEKLQEQNQKTMTVIQSYKQIQNSTTKGHEDMIQKLEQQKLELKDHLKIKEQQACQMNSEIRSLNQYIIKLKKEDQSKNLLEQELIELRKQNELLEHQLVSSESKICMLKDQMKNSESFNNISLSSLQSNNVSFSSNKPSESMTSSKPNGNQRIQANNNNKGNMMSNVQVRNLTKEGQMQMKLQLYKDENKSQVDQQQLQRMERDKHEKVLKKDLQQFGSKIANLFQLPSDHFKLHGEFTTQEQLERLLFFIKEQMSPHLQNQVLTNNKGQANTMGNKTGSLLQQQSFHQPLGVNINMNSLQKRAQTINEDKENQENINNQNAYFDENVDVSNGGDRNQSFGKPDYSYITSYRRDKQAPIIFYKESSCSRMDTGN